MTEKRLLIDATHAEETRIVIADENRIHDFDISVTSKTLNKGNIYLAKVTRVEPSLQAAFVEYGGGRQGFLPFSEIHPDYYQIPVADRKKLIEEVAAAEEAAEAEEEQENAARERGERNGNGRNRRRRRGGRLHRRPHGQDDAVAPDETADESAYSSEDATTDTPTDAMAAGELVQDETGAPMVVADTASDNIPELNAENVDDSHTPSTSADKEQEAVTVASENTATAENTVTTEDSDTSESTSEDAAPSPTYRAASVTTDAAVKSGIVDVTSDDISSEITSGERELDNSVADSNYDSDDNEDSDNDDSENGDSDEDGNGDDDAPSTVESLSDDDDFTRRRKASFLRRYNIQEVIKRNQVILVQVVKEERGNKGASLSTYISLAGRYCVLMPNSPKTGGISRKISSSEDRRRLKEISEEIRSANGMSAIIRTAGIDRTRAEIKRDYDYLVKLWNQIRELTLSSTAPALVYEEADIVKRSLRDLYSSDIKEVVISGEDAYKRAREFMKLMMPSHTARIKLHTDNTPIFYAYDAEEQLLRMHEPQVRLDSGGSIVINPTEALVSIDVNSGRSTSERNVEETALKTNLEAAQEIARQLRFRDLAGLIVIDFIDMFDYKNRRAVERQLKEALKHDRAKIQLGRISAFGLLEMSRQRLRPSFTETNAHACPHCEGRGFVLTPDAQAIQLLRFVEKEASTQEYAQFRLKVPSSVAIYLLNNKRERLIELEKTHSVKITIEIGENMHGPNAFILERYTPEGQKSEINGMDGIPASGKRSRSRKRKRDRGGRAGNDNYSHSQHDEDSADHSDDNSSDDDNNTQQTTPQHVTDEEKDHDRGNRRRRRGGRRRGGRNRDDHSAQQDETGHDAQDSGSTDGEQAPLQSANEQDASSSTETMDADDSPATTENPSLAVDTADTVQGAEAVEKTSVTTKATPRKRSTAGRPRKTTKSSEEKAAEVKSVATQVANAPTATLNPVAAEPAIKAATKAQASNTAGTTTDSSTAAVTPAVGKEPDATQSVANDSGRSTRKGWWRRMVE